MATKKKSAGKPAKKTAAARSGVRMARSGGGEAAARIDGRVRDLGDWRGATLEKMRRWIRQADPEVVEEWKWVKATNPGVPVWSHEGILCTGETYKNVVKLTFAKGASLPDPRRLFNSSLEGNVRRAIDIHENESIDEAAFKKLVQAAVLFNLENAAGRGRKK